MKINFKVILGIAAGVFAVLSVIWFCFIDIYTPPDDEEDKQKFDKQRWTVNWTKYENGENDRHFMLTDLLENHLKIGMDSSDVKKLLGEPERDFGFSYNLGLYRSPFDPTFLILEFDDKGKLKEMEISTI